MKNKTKKNVITMLSLALVATAAVGTGVSVAHAKADTTLTKPTGTNTATLTEAIADSDLESFKVYGASVRKNEPAGIRFLTTIGNTDVAEIPADAEFGTLVIPTTLLGDQTLEMGVANVLNAVAKVNTLHEDVPENSLGYFITLAGDTLATEFPAELYGTVFAARSYVKYTYTPEGETEAVTDYAYTSDTVYRSISYVASCELVKLETLNTPDTDSESFLNRIIAATTTEMSLTLSAEEANVGDSLTATVTGATDGVNAYKYILSSGDENVVKVNEDGTLTAVGAGTATISANIGVKEVTAAVEVAEAPVTAYSLAGYNGLSKLTVTFDAASLNTDDIAMAELRNADNETVKAVYAKAVDNVATFDMSGVANAEDYYAVITTQKTATPVITDVKADYQETYDLASIFGNLYAASIAGKANEHCDYTNGTSYGEKLIDNVKFYVQAITSWQTDLEGKVTYIGTSTSNTSNTPIKFFIKDKTDLTRLSMVIDSKSDTHYDTQIFEYDDDVAVFTKVTATGEQNLTTTDATYFGDTTVGIRFITWSHATATANGDYFRAKSLTLDYQKTLTVSELANENGNPAKVSDGVEVASYDLSAYDNITGLNVTFDETTETTATVDICDQYGDIVQTVEASISSNAAYFDLSAIENIENYHAVIKSNATVSSVTADTVKTYAVTSILQDLAASTATDPTYTQDNVTFVMDTSEMAFFNFTEDGKWYSNGTLTSNVAKRPFYWNFTETDDYYVKKINLSSTMDHPGYMILRFTNVSRWTSGYVQICTQQNSTGTLERNIVISELADGVWKKAMHSFIYIGANTASHFVLGDMTVTWEGAMTAGTLYVSAN